MAKASHQRQQHSFDQFCEGRKAKLYNGEEKKTHLKRIESLLRPLYEVFYLVDLKSAKKPESVGTVLPHQAWKS